MEAEPKKMKSGHGMAKIMKAERPLFMDRRTATLMEAERPLFMVHGPQEQQVCAASFRERRRGPHGRRS